MALWIQSNCSDNSNWHLAEAREIRGRRTGTLKMAWHVCACNGRRPGSHWGYRKSETEPPLNQQCPRCREIVRRRACPTTQGDKVL